MVGGIFALHPMMSSEGAGAGRGHPLGAARLSSPTHGKALVSRGLTPAWTTSRDAHCFSP